MQHPDKWRETADPFAIRFQNFKLERILGYPHAGNDVFHVEGIWKNRRCRGYLKVQRQAGANVAREAEWLTKVPLTNLPEVLEWSAEPVCWLLTKEAKSKGATRMINQNIMITESFVPFPFVSKRILNASATGVRSRSAAVRQATENYDREP